MSSPLQASLAPLAVVYTGGTLGCHGQPLRPLPGARLQPAVEQLLPSWPQPLHWQAWTVPLDSSQLTPQHWTDLLEQCVGFYQQGIRHVLILHGTDTLAYTGALLAEALAGSDLQVVLTGSQQPLLQADFSIDPDSDAPDNLRQAVQALFQARPGVRIAFAGESWPAQTVQKIHTRDPAAFSGHLRAGHPAVSYQPLSPALRQRWLAQWQQHWPDTAARLLAGRVLTHYFTPQQPAVCLATLHGLLAQQPDAVILQGYGSGNLPDWPELQAWARTAHRQGVLVVAATQVPFGGTDTRYACTAWLADAQVLPAARLTLPALYARLCWLVARYDSPAQRRRRWRTLLNDPRTTARDDRHER